ncbi:MAG: HAD family hydrolase [Lachnospiraceae bacterium]
MEQTKEFLICIDSDGCAFDTMEIKHKECFCPVTVLEWGLQPVAKYVREIWEYGNLYSRDRGRTRFHELVILFDWLEKRPEVKARGITLPDITSLRNWVADSPSLTNENLAAYPDDPILSRTLKWSQACNSRIKEMVFGIPPYPGVRESLSRLAGQCDIAIVSATAREALKAEWQEHDLIQYVKVLCGQEDGTKAQCIETLSKHYELAKILMIGDAPGDMEAAYKNNISYYPIRPGEETESWREFNETYSELFLKGTYKEVAETRQVEKFLASLPDIPSWERGFPEAETNDGCCKTQ